MSETKASAGLVSSESTLLDPGTAVFSLCVHVVFPLCTLMSVCKFPLFIRTLVTLE